jgi:cation:H+ antiporter
VPLHTDLWLVNVPLFIVGMTILIKGSDWFIEGAAKIARHFEVPDILIGLTLVSIGTSLPELATNATAACMGEVEVALGNVVGSNIANILLVLGVAVAGLGRVKTTRVMFSRDAVVMLLSFIGFAVVCYNSAADNRYVTRLEGALLLGACVWYFFRLSRQTDSKDELGDDLPPEKPSVNMAAAIGVVVAGGLLVLGGAKLMVDNVVWAADQAGVPKAVISATVIAFGTSVPELAITVQGLIKKKSDIAMGNIIGSNIFNLLLVMGATATIHPVAVNAQAATVLIPIMLASGVTLFVFMRTSWELVRWEGIVFLLGYAGFIAYNLVTVFGLQASPAG